MKNKKTVYYKDIPIKNVKHVYNFVQNIWGLKLNFNNGFSFVIPKESSSCNECKTHSGISFSVALEALKQGKRIIHSCWNNEFPLRLKNVSNKSRRRLNIQPAYKCIDQISILHCDMYHDPLVHKSAINTKLIKDSIPNDYIYVDTHFGEVPWRPSMDELLSDEWIILD